MTMKAVVAILLLSCLAVQGRELTAVDGPGFWYKCKAATGLSIKVRFGFCKASTSASCKAVAIANQNTVSDFKIFASNKVCDKGTVTAFSQAIAKAIAKVWVSASVNVECQGVGNFACGWAFADGQAWAHSFAQAYATAVAEVWTHKGSSFCFADVIAISDVFADAAAAAQADVCTSKGTRSDFEKKFAASISQAIATAAARASSALCSGNGQFVAESQCSGAASSTSKTNKTPNGPGTSSGGGQLKPCVGGVEMKCCYSGTSICRNPCHKCGIWIKSNEIGKAGNEFWRGGPSKETCICPPKGGH